MNCICIYTRPATNIVNKETFAEHTLSNLLFQGNRAFHIIVPSFQSAVPIHNTNTAYFMWILQKIKKHLPESPCP